MVGKRGENPAMGFCCVCLTWKKQERTRETQAGRKTYHNFEYSEQHRGWVCKSCIRQIERPKKAKENEVDQREMFPVPPPPFEKFWVEYPKRKGRKLGKQAARVLYEKIPKEERAAVVRAAMNYARSQVAKDGYARDANRFLKAGWWRDWEGGTEEDERDELIAKLRGRAGARVGSSTIVARGLESMHGGVTEWAELSTEKLRELDAR
jgi:hypothetical protein